MMVLVIVVGTALDFTPTVLILTPILMPLVKEAGINPVYFGVLFIMNNAIGLITPPVGIVLNVVCGVARVPMGAVIRGVTPFLIAQTIVLFLLVLLPQWVIAPLNWLRDRITFWEMLQAMSGSEALEASQPHRLPDDVRSRSRRVHHRAAARQSAARTMTCCACWKIQLLARRRRRRGAQRRRPRPSSRSAPSASRTASTPTTRSATASPR